MTRSTLIMLVLVCGCAGKAPPAAEPAGDAELPGEEAAAPSSGRKVWEAIPNAPHGQCCTSDEQCGEITCEPYEYATPSCENVCTYSCEPGDLCPRMGGTLDPPSPCPESGLCPVGPPFV